MINLLPDAKKRELRNLYRLRFWGIGVLFFGITLLVANVILGSFFILMRGDKQEIAAEIIKITERENIEESKEIFTALDEKLGILNAEEGPVLPTDLVDLVVEKRGEGVAISEFAYQNAFGGGAVTLKGVAGNRESLVSFIRALEAEPRFSGVQSPISNLSQSRNISFSVELQIKPEDREGGGA